MSSPYVDPNSNPNSDPNVAFSVDPVKFFLRMWPVSKLLFVLALIRMVLPNVDHLSGTFHTVLWIAVLVYILYRVSVPRVTALKLLNGWFTRKWPAWYINGTVLLFMVLGVFFFHAGGFSTFVFVLIGLNLVYSAFTGYKFNRLEKKETKQLKKRQEVQLQQHRQWQRQWREWYRQQPREHQQYAMQQRKQQLNQPQSQQQYQQQPFGN